MEKFKREKYRLTLSYGSPRNSSFSCFSFHKNNLINAIRKKCMNLERDQKHTRTISNRKHEQDQKITG